MRLREKHKWILIGAAAGLAGTLLIILSIHLMTLYIATRLIPRWADRAGLAPGQVRIRSVGLNGADVGPIRLDLGKGRLLEVSAVQIDYSLESLLRRRVDAMVLSGLNLDLKVNDRGRTELGRPHSRQQTSPRTPALDLKTLVPVGLGRLGIRNAMVTIRWKGRTFRTAVNADLNTGDLPRGRLNGSLQLTLRGNQFNLTVAADGRTNRVDMKLEAHRARVSDFSDVIAALRRADLTSRLDLSAQARWTLRPLTLASLGATARLAHARIDAGGTLLENTRAGDGSEIPLVIQLALDQAHNWHWSASPFQCSRPVKVRVDRLEGDFTPSQAGWRATAAAHSRLSPQLLGLPARPAVKLDAPLALSWTLAANSAAGGTVLFDARAAADPSAGMLSLRYAQAMLKGRSPYLSLAGRIEQGHPQVRFKTALTDIEAGCPRGRAQSPALSMTGRMNWNGHHRVEATLSLSDLRVDAAGTTTRLPKPRLKARLARGDAGDWRLTGLLDMTGGRFSSRTRGLDVNHVNMHFPLQWPPSTGGPVGTLKAAAILWKAKNIGGIKGKLALRSDGLHIDLDHASRIFTGLKVHIQSLVGRSGISVAATVPSYAPSTPIDIGQLYPAAAGVTVDGRIEARARITKRAGPATGSVRIHLEKGVIRQSRRRLALEGISGELLIDHLKPLRSAPSQHLRIDRLSMGKINARDLEVDYRIEPGPGLFIEKASLDWCRGKVQTAAVRLKPSLAEVVATLHCDRLNLAELLEQLGAARGSGEGSVNGSIPLRWQAGRISFDNGYLYSSPGRIGTIQLHASQLRPAGLPLDSPQAVQLDIAAEALKDYSYNWASLKLESRGEHLRVSLQLDGKPNHPLPFAYHPRTGTFSRIKGKGQAEFKGIGFTLNFDTPINEILRYKDVFTSKEQ